MSLRDDERNKAIGFDPVVWVERLIDVNDGSQFAPAQKTIIQHALSALRQDLGAST